ncbi:MAG: YecA family protein, partial [Acetobacteraceae bacterium]|nr:YecA family protein [Acetobacteraceae bacterium]
MDEDHKIIRSPLERRVTERGISVEVLIYRGEADAGWILEVVDHAGGSTVWDDAFPTDRAA